MIKNNNMRIKITNTPMSNLTKIGLLEYCFISKSISSNTPLTLLYFLIVI